MKTNQFGISPFGTLLLVCLAIIGLATSCRDTPPSPSPELNKSTISAKAKQIEEMLLRGDLVNETELASLPAEELRILRNVVFARHGRQYDRPGLGDYFYTCDWYKPNPSYSDDSLTANDKQNVEAFVRSEELAKRTISSPRVNPEPTLPSPVSSPQTPPESGDIFQGKESAAREYFLKEWELKFKKCGDTYYSCLNCGPNLDELTAQYFLGYVALTTNPSNWKIEPIVISEADDANNIKWAADLTVTASMSAYYDKKKEVWTQFMDGTLAFWNLTTMATRGQDIPIVFQVVEYKNGGHRYFYSNWYRTSDERDAALYHLRSMWKGANPLESCNEVPPRN